MLSVILPFSQLLLGLWVTKRRCIDDPQFDRALKSRLNELLSVKLDKLGDQLTQDLSLKLKDSDEKSNDKA